MLPAPASGQSCQSHHSTQPPRAQNDGMMIKGMSRRGGACGRQQNLYPEMIMGIPAEGPATPTFQGRGIPPVCSWRQCCTLRHPGMGTLSSPSTTLCGLMEKSMATCSETYTTPGGPCVPLLQCAQEQVLGCHALLLRTLSLSFSSCTLASLPSVSSQ